MGEVVTVPVRVRPGASRNRVGGAYPGPYGSAVVVAVTAPAVDGRATEAVRRALAAALAVRPADVALRRGARGRDKLLAVETDDPAGIRGRLARLRDGVTPDRPPP